MSLRRQAPAQLRDDAVHGGEVGQRARRQRAVELAERPRRRQVARALDLRALELAAQQRLEAPQRVARQAVVARVVLGQLGLRLGAQAERAADPLHVDADHARALLAARERRDRHPREVAHRALRAVAQRRRDLRAQRVELVLGELAELGQAPPRGRPRARPPARRRGRRSARTRARTRAGPPGSWRASRRAPRGSPPARSSSISPSTANASSSSEVPTATPSRRSSSPNSRIRAGSRAGGAPRRDATPPQATSAGEPSFSPTRSATTSMSVRCLTITDIVSVNVSASMSSTPSSSSARAQSIDSAIDGGFLRSSVAHHADHLDQPARDRLAQLGRVQAHDLELVLELGVVEPQVQAAALERLGQLARVVRGQQHDRVRARLHAAELGDRDLEVREHLEQHRLELLVGLVDLVDQQHDRLLGGDRRHQRAREQELLAEDVLLHRVPARARRLGLDAQQLLAVVPLVQRLRLVEALVALQAHELAPEVRRERLRQLGLADAGGTLDEHRLAELRRQVGDERGRLARQVADRAQARRDVLHRGRCGHRGVGSLGWGDGLHHLGERERHIPRRTRGGP